MRRRTLLLITAALPAAARAQGTAAGVATGVAPGTPLVERFHAALLEAMRAAARGAPARARERGLRPAVEAAFDLPAMARIAVGPGWAALPPEGQAAIAGAFADWTIATYAGRFDGYGGERFETDGEAVLANGDRLVRTRLLRPNDAPVALNYLLRGAAPRIVDVYLTGTISELASRRAEFTTILREGGPDRLAAELRSRTATLLR